MMALSNAIVFAVDLLSDDGKKIVVIGYFLKSEIFKAKT